MAKYRKKPVVIEAVQWTGENIAEIVIFMQPQGPTHLTPFSDKDKAFLIDTLEGSLKVSLNDWIIRGVKGEYYPCKPDIFEQTYEPVI